MITLVFCEELPLNILTPPLAFVFALLVCPLILGQEATEVAPLTIGETVKFKSKVLDENRTLNVYLPATYEKNSEKKYPVIYVLDGSLDEDFIHIAGIAQFGSFSWIKMIPESIVVGIGNIDRKRDFTFPSSNDADRKDFPTAGGSADFIKMLEEEVHPLIGKMYRTNGSKAIIGQSLGGLLATEILFKHPNMFDTYIIVSPSLWWDDGSLLKSKLPEFESPLSVFVGVGKEGEVMETMAKRLSEKIKAAPNENLSDFFEQFPELDHGDTLHLAVYKAFDVIYSNRKLKKRSRSTQIRTNEHMSSKTDPNASINKPMHSMTGVILVVRNFDECVAFYRDLFGLNVMHEKEKGDFRLTCLEFGGSYLMIESAPPFPQTAPEKSLDQNPTKLRFNVRDIEAALKNVRSFGIDAEIENHDWGSTINLTDPDGNRVGIRDDLGFSRDNAEYSAENDSMDK